jgi:membrane protein YdbS with pleckstrin-like domain
MQLRPSLKLIKLSYVLCLVLAVAMGVYLGADNTHQPEAVWMLVLPAILAFFALVRHLQRRLVNLTILGDRLRYESGLFSKTTRTIELIKVQDIRVDQTLGQRIIKVGDLSLETAGGASRIIIHSIDRPQDAADHILELARGQRSKPSEGDVSP